MARSSEDGTEAWKGEVRAWGLAGSRPFMPPCFSGMNGRELNKKKGMNEQLLAIPCELIDVHRNRHGVV